MKFCIPFVVFILLLVLLLTSWFTYFNLGSFIDIFVGRNDFTDPEKLRKNIILSLLGFFGFIIGGIFAFLCDFTVGKTIIWLVNIVMIIVLLIPCCFSSVLVAALRQ